jgi:diguanylate cyclase (GGDEF)-like protein
MASWEQTILKILSLFRLESIKRKILTFAVLATLIPSLIMGGLFYVHNKQLLQGKLSQEMLSATSHIARELDLWLKERFYDVRVFSSSYEVSENMEKILRASGKQAEKAKALGRLKDYLKSVSGKFRDYEELMVINPAGRVMASSAVRAGVVEMPPNWFDRAKRDEVTRGDAYWDRDVKKGVMMIFQPVKAINGRFLGVFAAKVNFRTIDKILEKFTLGKTAMVYLITKNGTIIIGSQSPSLPFMKTRLPAPSTQTLFEKEAVSLEFIDYQGQKAVGTLKEVPLLGWAVVAEIKKEEAFAQIVRLRNLTLLIVSGLLLGIGLIAYLLGLIIVRPLNRLTKGAASVAAGDLDVDLPTVSGGEVGYMTEVFNNMVASLRQGRKELASTNKKLRKKNKELKILSITDGLTGLYNRNHMMETLTREATQSQRYNCPFSVLMIDIDHFKKYNDSFGHPAGDDVLVKMGSIFSQSTRGIDYAGRYGGEEFLVMLPETGLDVAREVAERIRIGVAEETFGNNGKKVEITLSIGAAEFPEHGDTTESVVASADEALYRAKKLGRNRIVCAKKRRGKGKKKTSAQV